VKPLPPIGAVWRALGGAEIKNRRGRAFWRNGDGYNIAIDTERGCWYDWAKKDGSGGILDLVQVALAVDRAGAWRWMADAFGIERRESSPVMRRRIEAAMPSAERLVEWRESALLELSRRAADALAAFHENNPAAEAGDAEAQGRAFDAWAEVLAIEGVRDGLLKASTAELASLRGAA
jgi:hypothetical protein